MKNEKFEQLCDKLTLTPKDHSYLAESVDKLQQVNISIDVLLELPTEICREITRYSSEVAKVIGAGVSFSDLISLEPPVLHRLFECRIYTPLLLEAGVPFFVLAAYYEASLSENIHAVRSKLLSMCFRSTGFEGVMSIVGYDLVPLLKAFGFDTLSKLSKLSPNEIETLLRHSKELTQLAAKEGISFEQATQLILLYQKTYHLYRPSVRSSGLFCVSYPARLLSDMGISVDTLLALPENQCFGLTSDSLGVARLIGAGISLQQLLDLFNFTIDVDAFNPYRNKSKAPKAPITGFDFVLNNTEGLLKLLKVKTAEITLAGLLTLPPEEFYWVLSSSVLVAYLLKEGLPFDTILTLDPEIRALMPGNRDSDYSKIMARSIARFLREGDSTVFVNDPILKKRVSEEMMQQIQQIGTEEVINRLNHYAKFNEYKGYLTRACFKCLDSSRSSREEESDHVDKNPLERLLDATAEKIAGHFVQYVRAELHLTSGQFAFFTLDKGNLDRAIEIKNRLYPTHRQAIEESKRMAAWCFALISQDELEHIDQQQAQQAVTALISQDDELEHVDQEQAQQAATALLSHFENAPERKRILDVFESLTEHDALSLDQIITVLTDNTVTKENALTSIMSKSPSLT